MKGSQLSSSAKRIQKELAEISLDPPPNCSAGPKGDNIYEWVSTIMGPQGESCAGGGGLRAACMARALLLLCTTAVAFKLHGADGVRRCCSMQTHGVV